MSDLRLLATAAERLRRDGEPYVVATVVGVRGSSYRRLGARMILARDRWIAGSVSGGCLEKDVLEKAWWRTREGPVLVTYDSSHDGEWSQRLGCEGVVDVLLERAGGNIDPLRVATAVIRTQIPAVVATVLEGDRVGARVAVHGEEIYADPMDGSLREWLVDACQRGAAVPGALVETIVPPIRVFALGAGHDVPPLVEIARALGWDAAATTTSGAKTAIDASHRPAAVVMAHNFARDREALAMLLDSRARYIGVLGPRERTARMLEDIGVAGDARVHAPVGLDLGADTPQEIALAIVSEIQAAFANGSGGNLRDRRGRIH